MATTSDRVSVEAPLDIADVDRVRTALTSALADAAVARGRVVLDLTSCDFVDAVGYRMLSDAVRAAERSGVALHVVGVRTGVLRVIGILDGVLGGGLRARVATDSAEAAPEPRLVSAAPS